MQPEDSDVGEGRRRWLVAFTESASVPADLRRGATAGYKAV